MTTTSSLKRTAVAIGVSALLAPAGLIAVADAASTKTIKLNALQFSPRSVTIKKGDSVKFLWVKGIHNLIGPSVNVKPTSRGSKTVKFSRKGTNKYVCLLLVNMTTTETVK